MAKQRDGGLRNIIRDTARTLMKDLFGHYRPERHYMRGPGPKWREKHAMVPAPVQLRLAHIRH